ncbi:MAG: hypothetical protein HY403_00130 [Elusimicrobia bacterium]|nr:hypothetical protein [Elusimicrobiota bacterium]
MKLYALALAAVVAVLSPAVSADDYGGERGGRNERREGMEARGDRKGPRDPHGGDPAMREKFEKMQELEQKIREIARSMRQGSDSEKAAAKAEARKALGELFDAKLAMEKAMLEKMEKHAAELKAKIARKASSREKAIESRLARMSGEGDDWD